MTAALPTMARLSSESRDDASWLLIVSLLIPIASLQLIAPFTFVWRSTFAPIAFVIALSMAGEFYRRYRPDPQIVAMTTALKQMILFTCLGSIFSYMVAAQGGALWDARFQQWDQALGLNWRGYLAWVNAHPSLGTILRIAYASLIPQMVLVIIALGFIGKLAELRIVMFAAILSGTVAICISGIMPAIANYAYLNLGPQDYPNLRPAAAFAHVAHLEALRSGMFRTLSLDNVEGIITFPSYHAALATVFAWGFTRVPIIRWPGILLAALTLLATPIDGGHYFVDVFAGMAIAAASLWLGRRYIGFNARQMYIKARWKEVMPTPAVVTASPSRHSHVPSGR